VKMPLVPLYGAVAWIGIVVATAQDSLQPKAPLGPPPASIAPLENSTRVQIEHAESLQANGPAEEVLEAFRRVIDLHGDRLLQWPDSDRAIPTHFTRYRTVRDRAWLRLASLRGTAPDVLAAFRRQVDPQARRWFEQSGNERDRMSQRIVDELFLSSFGDNALLRLGDSALERGEYDSARRYLEGIGPGLRFVANRDERLQLAGNRPLWLPFVGADVEKVWPIVAPLFAAPEEPTEVVYPDTDLSLAEVRARLALVSILEGNFERAAIEIAILRQVSPESTGTIAGQTGKLVELTQVMLAEARRWSPLSASGDWSTFAGGSARNRVQPPIHELSDAPIWSVPLPRWTADEEALTSNRVRVAEDARGLLPYHPLVLGGLAVLQTQPSRNHVQAYRLKNGEPVLPAVGAIPVATESYDRRSSLGVPRFAPTADGMTMFLIEGFPRLSLAEERQRPECQLQAIDLSADRKLLWEFSPKLPELNDQLVLTGPPALDGARLFVTLRRREAARDEIHVAALDVRDGRVLWKQFIGAAEPATNATWTELTSQLLTVDQGTVYCNTNAGLVAALESRTGRVRWMTSYPRASWESRDPDRNHLHFYRDLNPCLVDRGVVVVAPTDCNRLFALDATNGIPLWVTPAELAADAVHLLGVANDRLAVSGECVYWFDIRTGQLLGRYPEPFKAAPGFARPSPRGYGRGILAGHHLYWPTRDSILVFDHAGVSSNGHSRPVVNREISLAKHGATGGNLVLANETLLVAGADRLFAFTVRHAQE
jgi:hypothetical protein